MSGTEKVYGIIQYLSPKRGSPSLNNKPNPYTSDMPKEPKEIKYIEKYGIACMLGGILFIFLSNGMLFSAYGSATYLFIIGMVFYLKPTLLSWRIMKYFKFSFNILIVILLAEWLIRYIL